MSPNGSSAVKRALAVPQRKPPVLAEIVFGIPRVLLLLVYGRTCFFWGADKVSQVAVPLNYADMEGPVATVTLAGKRWSHLHACKVVTPNGLPGPSIKRTTLLVQILCDAGHTLVSQPSWILLQPHFAPANTLMVTPENTYGAVAPIYTKFIINLSCQRRADDQPSRGIVCVSAPDA